MTIRTREKVLTFVSDVLQKKQYLCNGIWRQRRDHERQDRFLFGRSQLLSHQRTETDLIFLRYDTVPDDIREINAVDGLLIVRGGVTSHATVVIPWYAMWTKNVFNEPRHLIVEDKRYLFRHVA